MIPRTCQRFTGRASLGETSRGTGHPGQQMALRIHRGVRACLGNSEPRLNIGKLQILELVLTPNGAKIRQIPHNRPLLSTRLAGEG